MCNFLILVLSFYRSRDAIMEIDKFVNALLTVSF